MLDRIPPAREADAEDVIWALQTAETLWNRGERLDAIVWLRRAAQSAGDAEDSERAMSLAESAAELAALMGDAPIPSERPSPASASTGEPREERDEPGGVDDLLSTVVEASPATVDPELIAAALPHQEATVTTSPSTRPSDTHATSTGEEDDPMPPLESLPAPPARRHDTSGTSGTSGAEDDAEESDEEETDARPTFSDLDPFAPQPPRPPQSHREPVYTDSEDVVTSAPPLAISGGPSPVAPSILAPAPRGATEDSPAAASVEPQAVAAAARAPSQTEPELATSATLTEPPNALTTLPPSSIDDVDLVSIPPPPIAPRLPPPLPPSSTQMRAVPPPVPRAGQPRPGSMPAAPRPSMSTAPRAPAVPAPFHAAQRPPMPLPFRPPSRPDAVEDSRPPAAQPASGKMAASAPASQPPPSSRRAPPPIPPKEVADLLVQRARHEETIRESQRPQPAAPATMIQGVARTDAQDDGEDISVDEPTVSAMSPDGAHPPVRPAPIHMMSMTSAQAPVVAYSSEPPLYKSDPPPPLHIPEAGLPMATLPDVQSPTTPPPPPRFDLEDVVPLNQLPEDVRFALVRCAEILTLAPNDEVSGFGLALVLQGMVNVAATVAEAPALRAHMGDVLRSGGTADDQVKIRLVPIGDDVQVATWSEEEVTRALTNAPEVAALLTQLADRIQVRVGVALGPLGERLDFSLRTEIVDRLETRTLSEGEVLVPRGKAVPGMIVIGAGALELVDGDMVIGEVGPGEFLFADAVLGAGPAPFTARASKGGATILFGGRLLAQELLVTCPPLLELFAGM